jgi:hypothetical protein
MLRLVPGEPASAQRASGRTISVIVRPVGARGPHPFAIGVDERSTHRGIAARALVTSDAVNMCDGGYSPLDRRNLRPFLRRTSPTPSAASPWCSQVRRFQDTNSSSNGAEPMVAAIGTMRRSFKCRVDEDVTILIPHRSGCADFPLPVLHGRASLAVV